MSESTRLGSMPSDQVIVLRPRKRTAAHSMSLEQNIEVLQSSCPPKKRRRTRLLQLDAHRSSSRKQSLSLDASDQDDRHLPSPQVIAPRRIRIKGPTLEAHLRQQSNLVAFCQSENGNLLAQVLYPSPESDIASTETVPSHPPSSSCLAPIATSAVSGTEQQHDHVQADSSSGNLIVVNLNRLETANVSLPHPSSLIPPSSPLSTFPERPCHTRECSTPLSCCPGAHEVATQPAALSSPYLSSCSIAQDRKEHMVSRGDPEQVNSCLEKPTQSSARPLLKYLRDEQIRVNCDELIEDSLLPRVESGERDVHKSFYDSNLVDELEASRLLVAIVTNAFLRICSERKLQRSLRNRRRTATGLEKFYSTHAQTVTIASFVERVVANVQNRSVVVSALVYMDRLCTVNRDFNLDTCNLFKTFITAVTLASKYLEDETLSQEFYRQVGLLSSVDELNELEAEYLQQIQWRLFISPEEYRSYTSLYL